MTRLSFGRSALLAALTCAAPLAYAAGFGVSPIRLDFDAAVKTGAITVNNDDSQRLSFQLKLVEWSQDAKGQDQYKESKDLIFFPQILAVEPQDKRIIRLGTKSPPPEIERTYRLFIEELPSSGADKAKPKGTQIAVKLRFGVPLFVAPARPKLAGEIEDLTLAKGEIRLRVRNTGNQSFRFEKIHARAGDTVLGEVDGWYLLAGAARAYSIKLDAAACAKAAAIELSLEAGELKLKRGIEATPALCRR